MASWRWSCLELPDMAKKGFVQHVCIAGKVLFQESTVFCTKFDTATVSLCFTLFHLFFPFFLSFPCFNVSGYWRRPDLTLRSFVEHPELGRLYRTGDIGRVNSVVRGMTIGWDVFHYFAIADSSLDLLYFVLESSTRMHKYTCVQCLLTVCALRHTSEANGSSSWLF